MAKNNNIFRCNECSFETARQRPSCPQCNKFGTFQEVAMGASGAPASRAGLKSSGATRPDKPASTISQLNSKPIQRVATGIGELDRVLGGGFVEGSVTLFGAAPGSGKSTLCLAMAEKFADMGHSVLYSSGEESEQQIGLRAKRMGVTNEKIKITNETNLEALLGHIEDENPTFVVVDSLQALASSEISGTVGSIAQSKEVANALTRHAKSNKITMVLISQVVKGSEEFAGSNQIAHVVDTAIMLESDKESPLKFLRATKNRFGDISEVGVFQHSETGLEEVSDPGGIFLESDGTEDLSGTSCSFVSEGIRQIPVEIQALVTDTEFSNPRRQFGGVNHVRGQMICAILDKFCNAKLSVNDVFASTVAGIKIDDPMADLSIAASIFSSAKNKPVIGRVAFVGEIGLTGQVRGAYMIENKIREAQRLGFDTIVIPEPAFNKLSSKKYKIHIKKIRSVKELKAFFS